MKVITAISFVILLFRTPSYSQDTLSQNHFATDYKKDLISGFIRAGLYSWTDNIDDKLFVSSAFSDLGLKLETGDATRFKAFADLRFRYGSEFLKSVSKFDIREAFVKTSGKSWDLTLGQKIVKWGRCDFTNPVSKLSPQNLVLRSPDREDMDMGNLLADFNWYPLKNINLETVLVPYYRSSVLIIDPVPLPEYVTVNQINSLITDKSMFSFGLKADFYFKGIDWSISWFDGYDPLPGITLTEFDLDLTGPVPVLFAELTVKPFRNRVLGLDFETVAGSWGMRGEAAWSVPDLSYQTYEHVPMPEIKWAGGIDWSKGIWRFTGEYSGKLITDFTATPYEPIIGTEPDYAQFAAMLATPGFDIEEYIRQQVGAFNRLYNYQLERYYHSAGIRAEAEMIYGKLLPSVFAMYNFTSGDLLVIPEIKIKPADGLTITAGAEIFSGGSGSLYDLVGDFMNSVYVALRVDF